MKDELADLIADIRRELRLPEAERESQAPTSELESVERLLSDAEYAIDRGAKVRLPGTLSYLVVDGWSLTSTLSNRIVSFARRYADD